MYRAFVILLYVQLSMSKGISALQFEDITSEAFEFGENSGVIAAFGNFNSDEITDIVCLQQGGHKLQVFLGDNDKPYFRASRINCSSYGHFISSVVPGDFNGDSVIDVLITLGNKGSDVNEVKILWGVNDTVDCKSESGFVVKSQPLVADFNGDMLPDVIGVDESGFMNVWISHVNKSFEKINLSNFTDQKFKDPHSSGLIDLNDDLAADILIMGDREMEKWLNKGGTFEKSGSISYPLNAEYIGQSVFVDLNQDGKLDILTPVCYDLTCQMSAVLIWDEKNSKWITLLDNFQYDGITWGFKLPVGSPFEHAALPITLRSGDVNTDGYPDFIMVLQSKWKATDLKAVIFLNNPCNQCNIFNRSLSVEWQVPGLESIAGIQILAFYDIFEDGSMDILASTKLKGDWKMRALKNTAVFDSCFIKVLVLNGLCHNNCSMEVSYGVNQPGPMVCYNMTTIDGNPVVSRAVQVSQSAYFPLQLPYVLFGLGQTPNFIDVLTVAVPAKYNKQVHHRRWKEIIPNSQIVVIPYPPENEKRWSMKLFVTPSHLVMLTCIALVGTLLFIVCLVGLLHLKERKEDKKEKMQDAYRFHFDAM